jgi:hypothetical protein
MFDIAAYQQELESKDQDELDDLVISAKEAEAAEINNQGRVAQIAYLTAEPSKAAIELTRADWAEIFYALELKRDRVKSGLYGEDHSWSKHLDEILTKLGPDSEIVSERGVAPCQESL